MEILIFLVIKNNFSINVVGLPNQTLDTLYTYTLKAQMLLQFRVDGREPVFDSRVSLVVLVDIVEGQTYELAVDDGL